MGRRRVLSSDLPARGDFGHLSRDARLLTVLLYLVVDDEGRGPAEPALLRAQLYPHDEELSLGELKAWLDELSTPVKSGRLPLLRLYTVGEESYLELRDFVMDQNGRSRVKFRYPKPPKEEYPEEEEAEEVEIIKEGEPPLSEPELRIFELWNTTAYRCGLKTVEDLSERRRELAKKRWEEHPDSNYWAEVSMRLALSLRQGPLKLTPEVATIELLLQDGSAEKIINGLYDPPKCQICQKRFVEDEKKTCSDCESPRENPAPAH